MLQNYTSMRTKNKMKDSEVEYEEWWEVAKEYFTKELEKKLVQHKSNEFFLRYMLDIYQKKSRFCLWQSNKYRGIGQG